MARRRRPWSQSSGALLTGSTAIVTFGHTAGGDDGKPGRISAGGGGQDGVDDNADGTGRQPGFCRMSDEFYRGRPHTTNVTRTSITFVPVSPVFTSPPTSLKNV